MSTVQLKGFRELQIELSKMTGKLQKKVVSKMVRQAANVIKRDAKSLAPVRSVDWKGTAYEHKPGTLRDSIVVRRVKKTPKNIVRDVVLPLPSLLIQKQSHQKAGLSKETSKQFRKHRRKTTSDKSNTFYAMWVEYGHKMPGGGHFGGTPFMRPAFDKGKGKALQVMRREMAKGIKNYRKG